MAKRSECLCDGKIIGIETIYTVVDGKQINIEKKLETLRAKSQNKELFCPCGCGTNLILVAGEKQLKEQHFRKDDKTCNYNCEYTPESKISVQSKIILKCWLDDNIIADDLETRVPIYALGDISRKHEFSFLSRIKNIAVSYYCERESINDEKLSILDDNKQGLEIIYISDKKTSIGNEQYPERLMKIQKRQGYCLLLDIEQKENFENKIVDYPDAKMKAVFFAKNYKGLWQEVIIAAGLLKDFEITDNNSVIFQNHKILNLLKKSKEAFWEQDKKERIEWDKQQQLLESEVQDNISDNASTEAKKLLVNKYPVNDRMSRGYEANYIIPDNIQSADFKQQEEQIRDRDGNRWFKCQYCQKIAMRDEFSVSGGIGTMNEGVCTECSKNNEEYKRSLQAGFDKPKVKNICPKCGGFLVKRNGPLGEFLGCKNFPKCRYTKNI